MLKKVSLYGIIAVLGISPAIAEIYPAPTGVNGDVYQPGTDYETGTCGAPILGDDLTATSVTMAPQFIPSSCPAGQYLVVPGDNGEIAKCSPCPQNSYCKGISDFTWSNNQLSTQGTTGCPAPYSLSAGGVNATDINACYKTCNDVTLPHATSCSLASATVSYGNYCDVTCSGCANGYNNNKNLSTIMANATASVNNLTGVVTIAATDATLTGESFCEETSGGAATYDCKVRVTGLTQGNVNAELNANGSVVVATGYADLTTCQADCPAGIDVDGSSNIDYDSSVASLVATVGTKTICLPNVVEITWGDVTTNTCTYGAGVSVPSSEPALDSASRPAYCGQDGTGCTFLGWKVVE